MEFAKNAQIPPNAMKAKEQLRSLLKEIFINPLDMQDLFDPALQVVADHELGEVLSVDQINSLAEEFRRLFCGG